MTTGAAVVATDPQQPIDYSQQLQQILQNQSDFRGDFSNFNQGFSQFQEDLAKYHDSVLKFQDSLAQYNATFSKTVTDNHIETIKSLHTINDSIVTLDNDLNSLKSSFDVLHSFANVDWDKVFSTVKEFSKIYATVHFSIGILLGSLCAVAFILGINRI